MEGQRAADFVRGMNRLFEHTQTHALWSVAAGTVAAGYAAGQGKQDIGTSAVIGGSVLGAMIAIPTFGRAFATAIRHFDHPESRTYLQAVAKMVTIAQMHGAYTGRQPAPETTPEPTAVRPVEPPTRMAAPNLPSRPTGVRVPAPSPSPTSSGMPRVQNMRPLR